MPGGRTELVGVRLTKAEKALVDRLRGRTPAGTHVREVYLAAVKAQSEHIGPETP